MTSKTVTIAGEEVRLERVSARKASTALALLRRLSKAVDGIQKSMARFEREYELENYLELDRVQARLRFPERPLLNAAGEPVREPDLIPDTSVDAPDGEEDRPAKANPRAGELVMAPSPVSSMSDDDWAASGGKLRLPASPTFGERVAAVFEEALETAEDHVYELLALFLIPNEEVAKLRRDGTLLEHVAERADELLDQAFGDELLELAVAVGELVDEQFIGKARSLGGRMGNALRLFGMSPRSTKAPTSTTPEEPTSEPQEAQEDESPTTTSSDGPSSSRPSSSTASPAPTPEEGSTPGSTSPGTSSTPSSTASSATPPEPRPSEPAPA